jgi:hypothetical protein
MTDELLTVRRSTPGNRMAEMFAEHHVGHLVVCDDDQRMVGVVWAGDHRANPGVCAEKVMTPPPAAVSPKTALGAAISLLFEQGVKFLPVVEHDKLCGVLTPTDLALTLHCSLQLWFRVAQTMRTNAAREADLETASHSMGDIAGQLQRRVRRLPDEVRTAIRTGNAQALDAELDETMASVSQLMQQLQEARSQIRKQHSEIAELRDPAPDDATGAASREELGRILGRWLSGDAAGEAPLSMILFIADHGENERPEARRRAPTSTWHGWSGTSASASIPTSMSRATATTLWPSPCRESASRRRGTSAGGFPTRVPKAEAQSCIPA